MVRIRNPDNDRLDRISISDNNIDILCMLAMEWDVAKLKIQCMERMKIDPLSFTTEDGLISGITMVLSYSRKDLLSVRNSESSFLCGQSIIGVQNLRKIFTKHLILF
jgi:hypothetical protein